MAQFVVLRSFCAYLAHGQKALTSYRIPKRLMSFTCLRDKQPKCANLQIVSNKCKKTNDKVAELTSATESTRTNINENNVTTPPGCCDAPCNDDYPPFDALYYKKTDHATRRYQQTWIECPELLKKPKVLCYDKTNSPPLPKRTEKDKPKTACAPSHQVSLCPSLNLPGCPKGRKPPKFIVGRKTTLSQAKKAPYPSFSECGRRNITNEMVACNCLGLLSMCDMWAYYHRMRRIKKPLNVC